MTPWRLCLFGFAWVLSIGACQEISFASTQLLLLATEKVGIGTVPTLGGPHESRIFP
jgi:hypothetical protein